jgi:beta-glucosidase
VHNWITLNEPDMSSFAGHEMGRHAPGLRDPNLAWQVSHHLLLAHGLAVPLLRTNSAPQTRVGITLLLSPTEPATDTPEDRLVAQYVDGKLNRWFLDPVFRGSYPADMLNVLPTLGVSVPKMESGDAQIIARPIEFLGVNYSYRTIVHHKPGEPINNYEQIKPPDAEYTTMGWEVYPEGLRQLLVRLHRDYSPPQIFITENGAAFPDTISEDNQVHDPRRIHYLGEHIRKALSTLADGVPLAGYFVWSLMDNFEWAFGYAPRFGLVYVDYPTQRRIVKDSGRWYRGMIASGR